jgi:hypothetical protein
MFMDDENYRDLVQKSWELANAAETLQRLLNRTFFDEFVELDRIALENRLMNTAAELPF